MARSDALYAEYRLPDSDEKSRAYLLRAVSRILYDAEYWDRKDNPDPLLRVVRTWSGIISANLLDLVDLLSKPKDG